LLRVSTALGLGLILASSPLSVEAQKLGKWRSVARCIYDGHSTAVLSSLVETIRRDGDFPNRLKESVDDAVVRRCDPAVNSHPKITALALKSYFGEQAALEILIPLGVKRADLDRVEAPDNKALFELLRDPAREALTGTSAGPRDPLAAGTLARVYGKAGLNSNAGPTSQQAVLLYIASKAALDYLDKAS
jgi:hypothetical protein